MQTIVWVLSRWEGDYDTVLGTYSTEQKATEASASDFLNQSIHNEEEYHLYSIELDAQPKEADFKVITHTRSTSTSP